MADPSWAMGMRQGGQIWWTEGTDYVKLMKSDGPCVLIGLRAATARQGRHNPELARALYGAFASHVKGRPLAAEEVPPAEGLDTFWDDLATVLTTLRMKRRGAE